MAALRNFNGLASWRNAENSLQSVNLTMPLARSDGASVPPRLDNAIISVRFINGSPMVTQSVPPVALKPLLYAARDHPPVVAPRHRYGPRPGRHNPSQALENLRRHHAQQPPGARPPVQRLSGQGPVHPRRRKTQPCIAL